MRRKLNKEELLNELTALIGLAEEDGKLTQFKPLVIALERGEKLELENITEFRMVEANAKEEVAFTYYVYDNDNKLVGEGDEDLVRDLSAEEIESILLHLSLNLRGDLQPRWIERVSRLKELEKVYPNAEVHFQNKHEIILWCDFALVRADTLNKIKSILGASDVYVTYMPAKHIQGIVIVADYHDCEPTDYDNVVEIRTKKNKVEEAIRNLKNYGLNVKSHKIVDCLDDDFVIVKVNY